MIVGSGAAGLPPRMPVRIDDFHDRWSRVRDHDSVASLGRSPASGPRSCRELRVSFDVKVTRAHHRGPATPEEDTTMRFLMLIYPDTPQTDDEWMPSADTPGAAMGRYNS